MKRILIDVDTQHDFVKDSGSLFVPADTKVLERIEQTLHEAVSSGVPILGSVDSHAWDAWEFEANGGPFPVHCVKGTRGWLRVCENLPSRTRYLPMQIASNGVRNLVGEALAGGGARELGTAELTAEALDGVGLYFEKEVYSLFSNPVAAPLIESLVARMGGSSAVTFDVVGYCTGGYCVDAAVKGLLERGYAVRVLASATAAIGGRDGQAKSKLELVGLGAQWLEGVQAA
jgi:nicotinamidase/pyrazinamidase